MPILGGRHKSHQATTSSNNSGGSSSSNNQSSSNATSNQTSSSSSSSSPTQHQQQRRSPQLCESPLFGIRRQLPLGDATSSGGGGNSSSANKPSSASSAATCDSGNEQPLSSVPQQITRQQINYAFSIMDTNNDGMIDLRDLSQMLANLGVPIDEAILSHIMSSVSKRGDHRISEAEFLDWISRFIQVSDSPLTRQQQQQHFNQPKIASNDAGSRRRLPALTGGSSQQQQQRPTGRISRSSTSSLVAEASEVPRARRGSGSGLALMRSLSSSASSQTSSSNSPIAQQHQQELSSSKQQTSGSEQQQQQQQQSTLVAADLEARNDLKAAFGVFDLDGDGFITVDEVRAGLKLLGESWTPNELQHLFSKCKSSNTNTSSRSTNSTSGSQDLSKQRISIDDFVQLLL